MLLNLSPLAGEVASIFTPILCPQEWGEGVEGVSRHSQ